MVKIKDKQAVILVTVVDCATVSAESGFVTKTVDKRISISKVNKKEKTTKRIASLLFDDAGNEYLTEDEDTYVYLLPDKVTRLSKKAKEDTEWAKQNTEAIEVWDNEWEELLKNVKGNE